MVTGNGPWRSMHRQAERVWKSENPFNTQNSFFLGRDLQNTKHMHGEAVCVCLCVCLCAATDKNFWRTTLWINKKRQFPVCRLPLIRIRNLLNQHRMSQLEFMYYVVIVDVLEWKMEFQVLRIPNGVHKHDWIPFENWQSGSTLWLTFQISDPNQ